MRTNKFWLLLLCIVHSSSTLTSESLSLCDSQSSIRVKSTSNTTGTFSLKALFLLGLVGSTTSDVSFLGVTECRPTQLTIPLTQIPPYYADFRHPGKITVFSALENPEQLNEKEKRLEQRLKLRKKIFKPTELSEAAKEYYPALLGSCALDNRVIFEDLIERRNHAIALQEFEKTVALSGFGALSEDAFISVLSLVNAWILKAM